MKTYWLSNKRMTVKAVVNNGVITNASPIIRKFVGQPFTNLRGWLYRMDNKLRVEILNEISNKH